MAEAFWIGFAMMLGALAAVVTVGVACFLLSVVRLMCVGWAITREERRGAKDVPRYVATGIKTHEGGLPFN